MKQKNEAQVQINSNENSALKELEPKKQKKHFRIRYFVLLLASIGFVFYAVITIINQNVSIAEKKSELNELNKQINVVEIQSQYLEKVKNYEGDDLNEYMEKLAKDDLGYISEGERIFINVAGE